ncbi:hypothetical protein E4U42_004170 [Claviceps africana]|uniref:Uncharacterized protein n=1 Tax=Claviceps africana TaxID=83212 RepID=A0A8K0J7Y0_9HYPO|nr:hypothetical protein E4U42_004170 [Claviceps africana]
MSGQSSPLNATFEGHIGSTLEALMLFEACLSGQLTHVPRRPHDRERPDLIKSGNVFIYEEHASGIKRWTDGVSWSPSRILGNFLIYRELEKPFPPGEKKRALKKKKSPAGGISKPELPSSQPRIDSFALASLDTSAAKETERALIGSLIDSYPFKKNGLVKKTISINHQGVPHHMVSYYNLDDVVSGRLTSPSRHPSIQGIIPRPDLIMSQNFRAPLDEVEYGPEERGRPLPMLTGLPNAHDFGNGSGALLQRAMTLPSGPPLPMQSAYGTSGYAYNPNHHYTPAMSSSMLPPMSQPLSSPIALPSLSAQTSSHMNHSATSLQPSVSTPMQPSSNQLSYATQQQGNYSLDPQRAARFGADSSLVHTFPRNMPTHDCSRRNSAYEVSQPSDLSSIPLGHVTDERQASSNGSAYMRQASYYLPPHSAPLATPENPVFSHHRPIKAETDLPSVPSVEDGSQHFDLAESNPAWGFEGIDSSQGQQYFGTPASGNLSSWHGAPNGVGRS